ncbi:MAG: ORF6N domain-containing protein [Candidatus Sumerlaeota bacterium]|nr:ORF6N domain-containing protein [Candidatus Sumerlaeota bacterium]
MKTGSLIVPYESIERSILLIREKKVILDADLANLYGVETRVLNQAIRRNAERFPEDFMFQISSEELAILKSQSVTSSSGWGGRRKLPLAFTEHGTIMAASVLNSKRAVEVSVFVVRAFMRLREMLSGQKELAVKLAELERKSATHDGQILSLVEAIRQLMAPPPPPKRRRVGFITEEEDSLR